jgi:hypothetical protein
VKTAIVIPGRQTVPEQHSLVEDHSITFSSPKEITRRSILLLPNFGRMRGVNPS